MIKVIFFLLFLSNSFLAQQPFWVKTNGPNGGIVQSVYFDQYSSTLFAGTAFDGIYYSFDNGENWEKSLLYELNVNCFGAVNNIIFAGTDEGLLKSIDGGITWSNIGGDFSNYQIRSILVLDNNYIFIATSGLGVYLSTDNGVTWNQKSIGLTNNSVRCLSFDYGQTIFAGTSGDGLFMSTNYGDNWVGINSPGNLITGVYTDNNIGIYVITNGSLYYSFDDGINWEDISISVPDANFWDLILTDSLIYASTWGQGMYLTSNNGNSWLEINSGLTGSNMFISDIILIDTNIFGATNGGMIKSSINNYEWLSINNNLSITVVRSIFNYDNKTYVGTHGLGLFYTNDAGETWEKVNYDFESYILSSTINSFGHVFLGTVNSGIFRTTNNWVSWDNVGLVNYEIRTMATNYLDYVFAGTGADGIFFSDNNGGDWQPINSGLLNSFIKDIKIDSLNKIYAATQAGIYSSIDNGNNWQLSGLQNKNISKILIQNTNTIFACTYGEVYKTTDSGLNWAAINIGLPNSEISDILINSTKELFVATGQGVFRSFDGGINWNAENEGLTNTNVSTLVINENSILFCGTSGGGVFKSSMPSLVTKDDNDIPDSYSLSQNYPNPFNPATTINYEIPEFSFVTLKLYDVLGNEIATLVNGEKVIGSYEVEFDATSLPSGIYFYKLQAGNFIETKKMLLMK